MVWCIYLDFYILFDLARHTFFFLKLSYFSLVATMYRMDLQNMIQRSASIDIRCALYLYN